MRGEDDGSYNEKLMINNRNLDPSTDDSSTTVESLAPTVGDGQKSAVWSGCVPPLFSAMRYHGFVLLWVAALISHTGNWMCMMTIQWLVFDLSQSESMLGLNTLAMALPAFVMLPLAGVLADHLDRRFLLVITRLGRALAYLTAVFLAVTGMIGVWHLIGLSVLIGIANGVVMPAHNALMVGVVGRDDQANAVALNAIQFQISHLLGPILGGVVFYVFGAAWNFAAGAFGCVLGVAILLAMKNIPAQLTPSVSLVRSGIQGVSYLRQRMDLVVMLLVVCFSSLLGLPLVVLLPAFVQQQLAGDAAIYSQLVGCFGLGALIGACFQILRTRGVVVPRPLLLVGGVLLAGSELMAGYCTDAPMMAMLLVLAGFANISLIVGVKTKILTTTSDSMRGRASSYLSICMNACHPIGGVLAGVLAQKFSVLAVYKSFAISLVIIISVVLLCAHFQGVDMRRKAS